MVVCSLAMNQRRLSRKIREKGQQKVTSSQGRTGGDERGRRRERSDGDAVTELTSDNGGGRDYLHVQV